MAEPQALLEALRGPDAGDPLHLAAAAEIDRLTAEQDRRVEQLEALVRDCQADLASYLPPDSGITEKEVIGTLLSRLDGPQARRALGAMAEPRPIDLEDKDRVECWACDGTGEREHDCMDDTCCCLDPEPGICWECHGSGALETGSKEEPEGGA